MSDPVRPDTLREAERGAILRAMRACGGSVSAASARLMCARSSLYAKVKRLGITEADWFEAPWAGPEAAFTCEGVLAAAADGVRGAYPMAQVRIEGDLLKAAMRVGGAEHLTYVVLEGGR